MNPFQQRPPRSWEPDNRCQRRLVEEVFVGKLVFQPLTQHPVKGVKRFYRRGRERKLAVLWHFPFLLPREEKGCFPFTSSLEKGALRRTFTELDMCFLERREHSDKPWRIYPDVQEPKLQGPLATLAPTAWAQHCQSSKKLPDMVFSSFPQIRGIWDNLVMEIGREGVRSKEGRKERNTILRSRKKQDARPCPLYH